MNIDRIPVTILETNAQQLSCEICIPESTGLFEGHFPDLPLLAGVLQVHIAIRLFETNCKHHFHFKGIKRIKFLEPIFPEARVRLKCSLATLKSPNTESEFRFEYAKPTGEVLSLGTVVVTDA